MLHSSDEEPIGGALKRSATTNYDEEDDVGQSQYFDAMEMIVEEDEDVASVATVTSKEVRNVSGIVMLGFGGWANY